MVAINEEAVCPQCGLPGCAGPLPIPGALAVELKEFKCRSCGKFKPVGPGWRIQCRGCVRIEHWETAALFTMVIATSVTAGFIAGWLLRGVA